MKRFVAIGALLLALAGCGTVQNFTEGRKGRTEPYGGVRIVGERVFNEDPVAVPFLIADLPLSAVGDTLTLPITASLSAWRFSERLWYLAFYYDNTPPRSNTGREFWFNEQNTTEGTPTAPSRAPQHMP